MQSLRQIRQRVRSVENTRKLTRAMQMVAGAKLRRYESALAASRPYAEGLAGLLDRLLTDRPDVTHPLLERLASAEPSNDGAEQTSKAPVGSLLLVVSSDTGLCGSYNIYLIRAVEQFLASRPSGSVRLAIVGRKATSYFQRRSAPIAQHWTGLRGRESAREIQPIAEFLTQAFIDRQADEVWVTSMKYRSLSSYKPRVERWLPLRAPSVAHRDSQALAADVPYDVRRTTYDGSGVEQPWPGTEYLIEPDAQQVVSELVQPYWLSRLQMTVLEAFASEQAARMLAMRAATDNAEEVVRSLTLLRNKIRQASITKEILEVVGGAEALK